MGGRGFYWLGWLTALATVGLAAWIGWVAFNPALSVETEGTILSISMTAQNSECCPVTVEFTDSSGQRHEFSSPSGGTRGQRVGDELTVFYHPDDPTRAQTGDDRLTPLVVGGFALLVLTLVSWSFFVQARRRSL